MLTIATTFGGGFLGLCVGFWLGERQGGDFNVLPMFTAPAGGMVGGTIGVIVGVLIG